MTYPSAVPAGGTESTGLFWCQVHIQEINMKGSEPIFVTLSGFAQVALLFEVTTICKSLGIIIKSSANQKLNLDFSAKYRC